MREAPKREGHELFSRYLEYVESWLVMHHTGNEIDGQTRRPFAKKLQLAVMCPTGCREKGSSDVDHLVNLS